MENSIYNSGGTFIVIILIIMGWLVFMSLFNSLIRLVKVRFKLPMKKKFIGKTSPIYRLVYNDRADGYDLEKWELEYVDIDLDSKVYFIIPFVSLFQRLEYVSKEEFYIGKLSDVQLASINAEESWNHQFNEWNKDNKHKQSLKENHNELMRKINRKFDANYVK